MNSNDTNPIDNLVAAVQRAESRQSFYRPSSFGVGNTVETPATSRYEADSCTHCHASYGHKGYCPVLNREVAEAASALAGNASEADRIFAHGLGITL